MPLPQPSKVLLALLMLPLLSACNSDSQRHGPPEDRREPVNVVTHQVTISHHADQVEVMATIQAAKSAVISSRISGNIRDIDVALGSFVKEGEKLMELHAEEVSAKLQQARAQLSQAQRNLDREKTLLAKKASTPETVKSYEEALEIARAGYREAETMLSYATIKAPFDGRITQKLVDTGDLAIPGKALLHIETEEKVQVFADVPETLMPKIEPGMTMNVTVPAASVQTRGTVSEIAPIADRLSRTVLVKLNIDNHPHLRSGQFARVTIPGQDIQTVLIPPQAIHPYGQMERIFLAENGRARLRLIRTGKRYADGVEVLSGLNDGDRIILNAELGPELHNKLEDGQPIIPQ